MQLAFCGRERADRHRSKSCSRLPATASMWLPATATYVDYLAKKRTVLLICFQSRRALNI